MSSFIHRESYNIMITTTNLALQEKSSETIVSIIPSNTDSSWWRQATYYVACGLRSCRKDIPGLITLVGLFMLPSLAAVIVGSQPGHLAYWVALGLPWITIILGNMAAVLAIEALDAGQLVVPARILPAALRWLPRYLWTNGITTVLFWGLFMPLQWVIRRLGGAGLPLRLSPCCCFRCSSGMCAWSSPPMPPSLMINQGRVR